MIIKLSYTENNELWNHGFEAKETWTKSDL
jgi:hypothetical protein